MRSAFTGRHWRATVVIAVTLAFGLAMAGTSSVVADMHGAPHPAHLHAGTCEMPGEVVIPLSDVGPDFLMDGEAMAAAEMVGPASAKGVEISVTTAPAPLMDIVAGGHTLVVHESAENIQTYIACGDVGGVMFGESALAFGLSEVDDSDYAGVAWLEDNGDGTTTVTVFLIRTDDDMDMGDEMDHDMSEEEDEDENGMAEEAAATAEAAVAIEGFAFNPQTLEISVGTTVTWTNNDSAPHTVTQSPAGSGFTSGTLAGGDSFSFTFEEAGTYDYFCDFHPNMTGTVVVE